MSGLREQELIYIKEREVCNLLDVISRNHIHSNYCYVYFTGLDDFLVNGEECVLRDYTDFVAFPSPIYSMSLSPTSLKDLRPGDEKHIEVNINSLSNLPFQAPLLRER